MQPLMVNQGTTFIPFLKPLRLGKYTEVTIDTDYALGTCFVSAMIYGYKVDRTVFNLYPQKSEPIVLLR
jgi:hypothetical protein